MTSSLFQFGFPSFSGDARDCAVAISAASAGTFLTFFLRFIYGVRNSASVMNVIYGLMKNGGDFFNM